MLSHVCTFDRCPARTDLVNTWDSWGWVLPNNFCAGLALTLFTNMTRALYGSLGYCNSINAMLSNAMLIVESEINGQMKDANVIPPQLSTYAKNTIAAPWSWNWIELRRAKPQSSFWGHYAAPWSWKLVELHGAAQSSVELTSWAPQNAQASDSRGAELHIHAWDL